MVQTCLEDLGTQAIRKLAANAGFLTQQPPATTAITKTPFLFIEGAVELLPLAQWEAQLAAWVESRLPACVQQQTIPQVEITPGQPTVAAITQGDLTVFTAQYPLKVESPQSITNINPTYRAIKNAPLATMHSLITALLKPLTADPETLDALLLATATYPATITQEENNIIITLKANGAENESSEKTASPEESFIMKFAINPEP